MIAMSADQVMVVSSVAELIFTAIGPAIKTFPDWSPSKQIDVIAKAFPEFELISPKNQEKMFVDVIHFVATTSFSSH